LKKKKKKKKKKKTQTFALCFLHTMSGVVDVIVLFDFVDDDDDDSNRCETIQFNSANIALEKIENFLSPQ
jgi:hypothetical protein